ncbi:flavin reductase like domain-domain-containing protein [Kockovaella imperatae]|uniref:Flavin reductase like domain-domain-containing protein n=1 Tax=Kockovaella imperatae TaxID=4999 RepID=A0A1Y1UM69_9TREE|nr:flavin reductase like domain-domain-containing protein [Kockovaella imperatae]ORX39099.1 flavin reductase like domain-domain-containing protein [Kockovaella imperatae]
MVRRYMGQEPVPINGSDISEQLRGVMRNVPQPVALAVARTPSSAGEPSRYHGATLSSFTSLTLHPEPLVAFSLRLPSRLADFIRPGGKDIGHIPLYDPSSVSPSSATRSIPPQIPLPNNPPPHHSYASHSLTISLLAQCHAHLADRFARPGLDMSTAFSSTDFDLSKVPPGVKDALGILNCQVVMSLPLRDVSPPPSTGRMAETSPIDIQTGGDKVHGSELFICRVISVIQGDEGLVIDPLLYWRRKYISVQNQSEQPYTW